MKGSQDSKPYPLFNTHKDGRGKYGAKNGAQSNRGTQEMTEEEYNSFRKPNQGNAEETKKENKEEWKHDKFHARQVTCAWKAAFFGMRETVFCRGEGATEELKK
jgi:hypothetical protein